MKSILTPEQMRLADMTAIERYGIPSAILMENAARSAAEIINAEFASLSEFLRRTLGTTGSVSPKVGIFCGSGNNGGDGFAIARHLFGRNIKVFWFGAKDKMSNETLTNFESIEKLGIETIHIGSPADLSMASFDFDCIIDAMIGVGGSSTINGIPALILGELTKTNSLKIAIDVPTGLDSLSGIAGSNCFRADLTISMFAIKQGMLLRDGPDYCGRIEVARLGAPDFIPLNVADSFFLESEDIETMIPPRNRVSSKYDYGSVLVIAGSDQYAGAAALSANSAISSGAGYVRLFTTTRHSAILPEIIVHECPKTESGSISRKAIHEILKYIDTASSVIIGPGLTDDEETLDLAKELLIKIPESTPVIIDADGLRLVGKRSELRSNIILTPHAGELARITELDRKWIEENSYEVAKQWAEQLGAIILLKHVPTLITDGEKTYFNTGGNPGMATAGSGDVLSGIIGALLARGVEPLEAAATAAFLHSSAGDSYAASNPQDCLTASRLIEYLPKAFEKI